MASHLVERNALKDARFCTPTMIKVASLLNSVDIPNILWWNSVIDIYGIPTGDIEMSFVVDRSHLQRATETLIHAGLVPCAASNCHHRAPVTEDGRTFCNPAVHFHISFLGDEINMWPSIQLHIKDERLWALPLENDTTTFSDSENIIFADDARLPPNNQHPILGNETSRGKCRHHPGTPVRIPTPERYAEALLLLAIRDRGFSAATSWLSQFNYLLECDLIDPDKVNEPTRQFMVFPPPVSTIDSLDKAQAVLGDLAMQGVAHAEWAKGRRPKRYR
ncbi:predicted protein [Uncinocarpus reesii 1704]|uniref:Uncharacterized protein n=1 Tax=Uncinocarpus reesii (strain UAMH 1704) TaxID=336963 RepID=C4JG05_UNCRE|nr:uncharacterized protein UREG_01085 [Uncinocarpus reesii 1704]EEP76236.1 predicted protein [Uncinocarpus reesii 1704]